MIGDENKAKAANGIYKRIHKAAADLDASSVSGGVTRALQPLLNKHGIFAIPELLETSRERLQHSGGILLREIVKIKYTFFAADGSSVVAVVSGEGVDAGGNSLALAHAAAYDTALCQIFCLPCPLQSNSYELKSAAPAARSAGNKPAAASDKMPKPWAVITEFCKDNNINRDEAIALAKELYNKARLNDLDADQVKELCATLKQKAAQNGGAG